MRIFIQRNCFMAIFLVLLAGAFVALSNLFMRKSIDSGGTTKGFMVFQMFISFLCTVLLEPVRGGNYSWNTPVVLLGTVAGLIVAFMLIALGKALLKGPPGITFSILSGATVMPALLMSLFFGAALGFPYTPWHALGSTLVVGGLFWAGKGIDGLQDLKGWIVFCVAMFALHVGLLTLFQWRAMLLNIPNPEEVSGFFTAEEIKCAWFLPCMFFVSGVIQLYVFLTTEKRRPKPKEMLYGIVGGVFNGTGTFFLICATQAANPLENAIIFPMFSVAIIVFSNIWGQKLYQEKVNWKACQVSIVGLIIGTVDWKGVAASMGF